MTATKQTPIRPTFGLSLSFVGPTKIRRGWADRNNFRRCGYRFVIHDADGYVEMELSPDKFKEAEIPLWSPEEPLNLSLRRLEDSAVIN